MKARMTVLILSLFIVVFSHVKQTEGGECPGLKGSFILKEGECKELTDKAVEALNITSDDFVVVIRTDGTKILYYYGKKVFTKEEEEHPLDQLTHLPHR